MVKYHANGKEDDPLVDHEFREILEALSEEEANSKTKYSDYLKGLDNRRRLLIIIVVSLGTNWVGNGIVGYYLATGAALGVDKAGRRRLWLISTIGMFFSFCITMELSAGYDINKTKAIGVAVIPFLFIFYGFYDIAWTPLSYS